MENFEGIADIGITIREEGVIAGLANSVRDVNFVGALVDASVSGTAATITVQAVDPGGTDGQVQYNDKELLVDLQILSIMMLPVELEFPL